MTNVAKHINNMKRKHEDAVRLQVHVHVFIASIGLTTNAFQVIAQKC